MERKMKEDEKEPIAKPVKAPTKYNYFREK
jgi:hypothetical protein